MAPNIVLHVRTVGEPSVLAGTLRQALQGLDSHIPFVTVRPLTALIAPQITPWKIGSFVLRLVLGQSARVLVVGRVLGAALAALGSRLFTSMMYGITALDPLAYAATAALLSAVALAASFAPAYRATHVDPMEAPRTE